MIQDQLVLGIADKEILADLLGDERTNRSTADIVEYIACKEQATAERTTVSGDATTGAVTTPKRGARPCRGCDDPDHGGWVGGHRDSVAALQKMSRVIGVP